MRGKYWGFEFRDLPECYDGLCEPPDKLGKKVFVKRSLYEPGMLDTIIHEFPDLSEDAVEKYATDMANIIHDLYDASLKEDP